MRGRERRLRAWLRLALTGASLGAWSLVASCTSETTIGSDAVAGGDGGRLAEEAAAVPTPGPDAAPYDVAGHYTLVLKAGANGCAFASWQVGQLSVAETTFAQSGGSLTATVDGFAAITYGLTVGSLELTGTVTGPAIDLVGRGVIAFGTETSCPFTYDAHITARADADALEGGHLVFSPVYPALPACAALACTTEISFVGLRATGDH